jgi:hypothetical protein
VRVAAIDRTFCRDERLGKYLTAIDALLAVLRRMADKAIFAQRRKVEQ